MRKYGFQFDQNDVDTDLADAFERDKHVAALFKNAKNAVARHDESQNFGRATRKHDVANAAQNLAVDHIDNLFTTEFAKGQL